MDTQKADLQKRRALLEKATQLFEDIQDLYMQSDSEEEFLNYFKSIGFDLLTTFSLLGIARHYDKEEKRICIPSFMEFERFHREAIGGFREKWHKLIKAIENHKAGIKGSAGGLKECINLISEDKSYRMNLIIMYRKQIQARNNDFAYDNEILKLFPIFKRIPEKYRMLTKQRTDAVIVIEWMAEDYGCSENTLKQYLYNKKLLKPDEETENGQDL